MTPEARLRRLLAALPAGASVTLDHDAIADLLGDHPNDGGEVLEALRDVLDAMGWPLAVARNDLVARLDTSARIAVVRARRPAALFGAVGYSRISNPERFDGLWRVGADLGVVLARIAASEVERMAAARELTPGALPSREVEVVR